MIPATLAGDDEPSTVATGSRRRCRSTPRARRSEGPRSHTRRPPGQLRATPSRSGDVLVLLGPWHVARPWHSHANMRICALTHVTCVASVHAPGRLVNSAQSCQVVKSIVKHHISICTRGRVRAEGMYASLACARWQTGESGCLHKYLSSHSGARARKCLQQRGGGGGHHCACCRNRCRQRQRHHPHCP